ncbi:hypothetical protein CC78DRAFT_537165 [Lojkania enalia]|uniref:Xaa-Pro aminopeptidase n=1 Tax=Lojkania enalia TaxID=147567 RepID=A0A9P4N5D9_9PLEO|nr:hypothetical protein CC78DRAFT_537165 [Didymosphaeria enalia]
MERIDAINLTDRLRWEQQEYWLHLEAASPLEKYPAKQHARRVVERLGVTNGLIYLLGRPQRNIEDSDMPVAFRQRRYFYYLSGVDEPDCHLTYDIQNDSLALFIPRINPTRVIYEGSPLTPAEALDWYDIDQVYYADELEDFVRDWSTYYKGALYILHNSQNPLKELEGHNINSKSLKPMMDLARVIKDDHEIKLIKKANDISSYAHKKVLANVLKFKNEAQVEGLFRNVCISKLAKEQAYYPIAASGRNAGTLHYNSNNEDFGDRQLMCLDAGCEYKLYASDITRTFPLSGSWPSIEAKNIYELVQRMQETCIDRLKPGVRYLDVHILAHQIAIDGLLSLGLLHNGTREEIYKAGTSRAFFPHGLGHHVGLEVHDVGQGDLMNLKKTNPKYQLARSLYPDNFHVPVFNPHTCQSPVDPQSGHLEEGMVVTVEPGIYFSTYLLNMFYLPHPVHSKYINTLVVNRYLSVGGVRIEDDILITSKGHENLTTAPKGEAMLEIIRSQNPHWPFVSESVDQGHVVRGWRSDRKSTAPVQKEVSLSPDIHRHGSVPLPQPLGRTSNISIKKSERSSIDLAPFSGLSLYANFPRSSTTDENVKCWKTANNIRCQSPEDMTRTIEDTTLRKPVCGEDSITVTHAYMDFPAQSSKVGNVLVRTYTNEIKPTCRKCTILVQTVDRLRQNLVKNEQDAPKKPRVEPAATRKVPEMKERPRASRTMPVLPSQAPPSKDALREKISNLEEKLMMFERKLVPPTFNKSLPCRQSLPNLQNRDMLSRRSMQEFHVDRKQEAKAPIPALHSRPSLPPVPAHRSVTFDIEQQPAPEPSRPTPLSANPVNQTRNPDMPRTVEDLTRPPPPPSLPIFYPYPLHDTTHPSAIQPTASLPLRHSHPQSTIHLPNPIPRPSSSTTLPTIIPQRLSRAPASCHCPSVCRLDMCNCISCRSARLPCALHSLATRPRDKLFEQENRVAREDASQLQPDMPRRGPASHAPRQSPASQIEEPSVWNGSMKPADLRSMLDSLGTLKRELESVDDGARQ